MKWIRMNFVLGTIVLMFFVVKDSQAQLSTLLYQNDSLAVPPSKLNQTDKKGRRQGLWYIDQKEVRGQDAYIAFGEYVDDKKQGLWYRMDHLGRLIYIRNFADGVLDGTSQYYQNGNLVCVGNYRGLNPKYKLDSIWVVNPVTGYDTMVRVPSEKGSVKHGIWRYYNPVTGQLVAEEKYQVDELLYRKEFKEQAPSDSLFFLQTPQHPPIDKKKAYHDIPERAKRKIGY